MEFFSSLFSSCFPLRSTTGNLDNPDPPQNTKTKHSCVFCNVTREKGFNIVWENDEFVVFTDRSPVADHHLLLTPKAHISSVKSLTQSDVPLVQSMETIGHQVLDSLDVPPEMRQLGFHIPPFTSIAHLHLHILGLPYRSFLGRAMFPLSPGRSGRFKGFSWFAQVEQAIQIFQQGKRIGVLPC